MKGEELVIKYKNTVKNKPKVSILITTYNHEKYIEKCILSILNQKIDYSFEILVSDDESSDRTTEICKRIADKHPTKIRLFIHSRKNNIKVHGAPTGRYCFLWNLEKANGQYFALCDGDDFWIDENKLKKQIDYLESNEGAVGCSSNSECIDENSKLLGKSLITEDLPGEMYLNDLLDTSIFGQTSTVVFRKSAFRKIDKIFFDFAYDRVLYFVLVKFGFWKYFEENFTAYRIHSGGVFSKKGKERQLLTLQSINYAISKLVRWDEDQKRKIYSNLAYINLELFKHYLKANILKSVKYAGQYLKYEKSKLIGFKVLIKTSFFN